MKVFLSYPSAERSVAERVNLALLARGYDVFFDRDDLSAGKEYDATIARSITASDLFIFLITPASVSPGRYTLTELGFAQQKWPHPTGRVLPVMLRETPIDAVPSYLRAVSFLIPRGDPVAEIAQQTDRLAAALPLTTRLAGRIRSRNGVVALVGLVVVLAILGGAFAHRQGFLARRDSHAVTRLSADVGRRARAVASTADGGFVVVAGTPSQLLRYSATGTPVGAPITFEGDPVSVGRTPATIAVVTRAPDGLVVFDAKDLRLDHAMQLDPERVRRPRELATLPRLSGDIQSVAVGGPTVGMWWAVTGNRDGTPAVLRFNVFDKEWEVFTWSARPEGIVGGDALGLRLRHVGRDLWGIATRAGSPTLYHLVGAIRVDTMSGASMAMLRCARDIAESVAGNLLLLSCDNELQEVSVEGGVLTLVSARPTVARDSAGTERTGEIIAADSIATVIALNATAPPNDTPTRARIVELGSTGTVTVLLDERGAIVRSMAVTPRLVATVLHRRDGSTDVAWIARATRDGSMAGQ